MIYDIVIIGSGPAGMTAALYAARNNLKAIVLEKELYGGEIAKTGDIENYPGFTKISGMELSEKMKAHAEEYGAKFEVAEVLEIKELKKEKVVVTKRKKFKTKTVIIATGSSPKKLGIPGEKNFYAKGVHFCALCDGPLYKGKTMAVIGGGDSAVKEAVFLAEFAKKVYVIHRRDELRAQKMWEEKARKNKKIQFVWNTEVKEFIGTDSLEKIKLYNNKTKKEKVMKIDAVFEYIGLIPNTKIFDVKKDKMGLIVTNECGGTSKPGVFAAGDCMQKCLRQIANCVGEGASAAMMARSYIENMKWLLLFNYFSFLNILMKYNHAHEWSDKIEDIVKKCEMDHIDVTRVKCIKSKGTSTKNVIARIHSISKAIQLGMEIKPFYVIELITEQFDKLNYDDQVETLIHELMHIPATFGGGFRPHKGFVTNRKVKKMFDLYQKKSKGMPTFIDLEN